MSTRVRAAAEATRAVRVVALSMALTLLPFTLVVQEMSRPGTAVESTPAAGCQEVGAGEDCGEDLSAAATATIGDWTASGLRCTTVPRLTDRVVVEWPDGSAGTVTFDRAVEVAAQHSGRLRAYCD